MFSTASARVTPSFKIVVLNGYRTVTQIKTYNFDDVNSNGIPDENETDSIGYYSVSYIGDTQITDEECASYNVGEYQYIQTEMDLETLKAKLNN